MTDKKNITDLNTVIEITKAYEAKEISIQDWMALLLGDDYRNVYSDEYCRRAEKVFSLFIEKVNKDFLENADKNILDIVNKKEAELKREKEKIRQEKNQLSETYRWQARNELFQEKILNAIENLEPIKIPEIDNSFILKNEKNTALLCLSDFHAGSTYEVKGAYGEIINEYNWDIMVNRMNYLSYEIIHDTINYNSMLIAVLGDAFENVLRLSSLMKLREPVLDTVIKFSEFFANWIVQLYSNLQIPMKIVCVGGNHDIQRLLGQKPSLEDENLMKIVVEFLKLRLGNFSDIIIADYSDAMLENIRGTSILFEHGEDKDLTTTIDYFENLYNTKIDEIYAGHFHSPENKTIGLSPLGDRQINRVSSICGLDPYSKKIRKAARPSAYMALYSQQGKGWNRTIYL